MHETDARRRVPTVTFDSNVIEQVLHDEKRIGKTEKIIYNALSMRLIKGFVARTYFAHDAIKKDIRLESLCDGIEFRIPSFPALYRKGIGLEIAQTSITELNRYNEKTISAMRALNMEVLDFRRALWPDISIDLPIAEAPEDYYDRIMAMQRVIEDKLHCGFYRLRDFMKKAVGEGGDDLKLVLRLKECKYNKKAFARAFSEAADEDAISAHYGYGEDYFCTDDKAVGAGEQSVFSQANRNVLNNQFGIRFVSSSQLADLINSQNSVTVETGTNMERQ